LGTGAKPGREDKNARASSGAESDACRWEARPRGVDCRGRANDPAERFMLELEKRSDTSASGKTHAAGNAIWLIWQRPKRTRYRPTGDARGRQIARRYRQSLGGYILGGTSLTTATFSGMKVPVVRRSAIGVARLCLAAHAFG